MPVEPKIPKRNNDFEIKVCSHCARHLPVSQFSFTHSELFSDHRLPMCDQCITEYLKTKDFKWEAIDKLCQWADIPFIVKEWTRLKELNTEENVWHIYAKVFANQEYENFGWDSYDKQYRKLKEVGLIEEEIPEVREKKYVDLRRKWGSNYEEEELNYLEDLYKGLLVSQNVNGALQIDQAQKLCKISLEIDSRIRAGDKDVEKFMSSYDRLVKIAEFTPKNTKNASDFDSFAELAVWLEKRGFQNKFYDGTTRDIIDETLKNIANYNRRLYINEGGIGEEIAERVKSLNNIQEAENIYDTQKEFDLDKYDNAGFEQEEEEAEEFEVELEEAEENGSNRTDES